MRDKLAAALRAVREEQRSLYSAKTQILLLPALISLHVTYPGLRHCTERSSRPEVACVACHLRARAFCSVAPVGPFHAL